MSQISYLSDILIRHQIYLMRYSGTTEKELSKQLKVLSKDLKNRINDESNSDDLIKMRKLQQDIDNMLLQYSSYPLISESSTEIIISETKFTTKVLKNMVSVKINTVAPELIISSINNIPAALITGNKTVNLTIPQLVDKFDSTLKKSIQNTITTGIINGDSINVISANVNRIATKRTRAQTKALVRTVVNHSTSVARSAVYAANGAVIENEKYVATLDGKTTLICIGFDGKIYILGQGPQPPMHYSCRSIRVAIVKKQFVVPGLKGERPSKSRDSEGKLIIKPVSSKTTYGSWLKKQPVDFQDDVLGPKRAKLFRDGKVKINDFTDDSGKVLNLSQLESKYNITTQ